MNNGFYGFPNILGLLRATNLRVLGKAGATAGAGLAGGTTSGAPTSGSFDAGEAVIGADGTLFICTVAGSPGTWVQLGTLVDPLTTRGDIITRGASSTGRLALGSNNQVLQSNGTDVIWGASPAAGGGALTQISRTVVGTAVASVTISSIPATYSHLWLLVEGRGTNASNNVNILLVANSDQTALHYDWDAMDANNSSFGSGNSGTGQVQTFGGYLPGSSATASHASGSQTMIYDYATSAYHKHFQVSYGLNQASAATGMWTGRCDGWWRSTAAITSITVLLNAGNLATDSTVTLYGLS